MKETKYLQRFFMLLFIGFALCAVQACSEDESDSDKPLNLIGVWEHSYNGGYDLYQFNNDGTGKGITSEGVNWTFKYDLNIETLKLIYTKENESAEVWNIEPFSSSSIQINGEWILSRTNKKIEDIEEKPQSQYEAVDLGLSVKWASCNIGASKPEEFGDYFAWGETDTKKYYTWYTYKWGEGDFDDDDYYVSKYSKYDKLTFLDSSDDVATVKWGKNWRMPTLKEMEELYNDCIWMCVKRSGVLGCEIVGPTGNSIFLPAANRWDYSGYNIDEDGDQGFYWTSTLSNVENDDTDTENCAFSLSFRGYEGDEDEDLKPNYMDISDWIRYCGFSVRPVAKK